LLRFVRDDTPSTPAFTERFGDQAFHTLRKHGVIVVENDRVRVNRRHLSPDGQRFVWGSRIFLIDRDEVLRVRYGPEGPPVFADAP
jgi:hypothetical protein